MTYYVVEIQTGETGALLYYQCDDRAEAEGKYHHILSIAAQSSVWKHGAMLLNEDLEPIKSEIYKHDAPAEEVNENV